MNIINDNFKQSVVISFITYNESTFKYLKPLSETLKTNIENTRRRFPWLSVSFLVFDNSDKSFMDNKFFLENFFVTNNYVYEIKGGGDNLGFARAYNIMIRDSISKSKDLFLMLNPDVILEDNFLEKIIEASFERGDVSVFAPKIMYWDFNRYQNGNLDDGKTEIIDSYGLGITRSHRFFDRGQGLLSSKYSDESKEVFGFTGAGALLRLSEIEDVILSEGFKNDNGEREFFDEMMFMYKEDVDFSYRLQLFNKKILFLPSAKMYHDRSLSSFNSRILKKIFRLGRGSGKKADNWSYLHQLMILYKIRKISFNKIICLLSGLRGGIILIYGLFFKFTTLKLFFKKIPKIREKSFKNIDKIDNIRRIEGLMLGSKK